MDLSGTNTWKQIIFSPAPLLSIWKSWRWQLQLCPWKSQIEVWAVTLVAHPLSLVSTGSNVKIWLRCLSCVWRYETSRLYASYALGVCRFYTALCRRFCRRRSLWVRYVLGRDLEELLVTIAPLLRRWKLKYIRLRWRIKRRSFVSLRTRKVHCSLIWKDFLSSIFSRICRKPNPNRSKPGALEVSLYLLWTWNAL